MIEFFTSATMGALTGALIYYLWERWHGRNIGVKTFLGATLFCMAVLTAFWFIRH